VIYYKCLSQQRLITLVGDFLKYHTFGSYDSDTDVREIIMVMIAISLVTVEDTIIFMN
jgi:hypothetical protein